MRGQPLGLAIDHFPRDQLVFEVRVAVDKAAPLLFPLRWRRLGGLGGLNKLFQGVGHFEQHNLLEWVETGQGKGG